MYRLGGALIGFHKKTMFSFIAFILVMSLFIFTARIEYNRSYQNHIKQTQDKILFVKLNLESLIASRMIAINGLKAHVEINPNFSQEDFNYFAKGIYDSSYDVVQSMSFLTDTIITHIYPYEDYKDIIGIDLGDNEEQRSWIYYAKENQKAIITAPVNLVEGGLGIIVRVPVLRQDEYFGQVSIVFDYNKTLTSSGLLALDNDYYIELDKKDELSQMNQDVNVVWSNFNKKILSTSDFLVTEVQLFDSSMTMLAKPKEGFNGKSQLFYIILAIGWIISITTGIVVNKLLSITADLALSEIELKDNNEELEAMVNQLKANEEQLYSQYDEIIRQKEQIKSLADCDYLTNLYNRRRFSEDITLSIQNKQQGTILLFDIDNFKNINDTQGHHYGDRVLKHIGEILKKILCKDAVVYRIGGDEFAIHLPGIIESNRIESCIDTFFEALKANNIVDQIKNHITASVGIAKYPEDSVNADDLLMKSDIAMYKAKNDGKNRHNYFTESLVSNFDFYVRVEKELQNALEGDGFKLLYQPIINAKTGEVESLEALIRIRDSLLSPADFIPIAEKSGLIVPMGRFVIDEVCKQLYSWQKKGVLTKPIAINISAKQLYEVTILEYMVTALKKYDLTPNLIEIEITESVLIENSGQTIKRLKALRELGFRISLDDFGTGYSSLSYLTYMPVDKVKIDKSLKDKFLFLDNAVVMEAIISICHGLKMKVVTEGVETKLEFEKLREYGSDFVQGYHFEKPLSAELIPSILNENYMD